MTYVEALNELRQRSIAALKVAQSTQLASVEITRELTEALAALRNPIFVLPNAVAQLTTTFAFALLEQQVAYARTLTGAFAAAPNRAPAQTAPTIASPCTIEPPHVADAVSPSPLLDEAAPTPAAMTNGTHPNGALASPVTEAPPIGDAIFDAPALEDAVVHPPIVEDAIIDPPAIEEAVVHPPIVEDAIDPPAIEQTVALKPPASGAAVESDAPVDGSLLAVPGTVVVALPSAALLEQRDTEILSKTLPKPPGPAKTVATPASKAGSKKKLPPVSNGQRPPAKRKK